LQNFILVIQTEYISMNEKIIVEEIIG